MEGLLLSSSSTTTIGCVVLKNKVPQTPTNNNNKSLLFQKTTNSKNHFFHLHLFQRGPSSLLVVPAALSDNNTQEEQENEDEEDSNEQETKVASFVALSNNQQDEDEDKDEDDQVVTNPIQQVVSTPMEEDHHNPPITASQPHPGTTGTTSTRAGLFRTPISGGVQSATSVHDLPPPPLAVRNLMEQARFAHLCTVMSRMHHRREGYPFGSLVDFATDDMGHPIFSFSPLAIHTRNLLADPRCTLVVQIPGWSGLSNARVTIFGDVFPLPEDQQEWAHQQYIAKHHQGPSQKWGNFYYFRMQNISDIYFIGGFGTVAWVNVSEYEALRPDKIAVDGGEQNLKELNAIFSKPIKELLSLETEVDDAALISIDSKGTDVRVRQGAQFNIQRLAFEEGHGVETLEEAKAALWNLIHRGGGLKLDHKF